MAFGVEDENTPPFFGKLLWVLTRMPVSALKTKPRAFISVPDNRHLDSRRKRLKESVIRFVASQDFEVVGFEPEQFGTGLPVNREDWTLDKAIRLMQRCDGAIVLALARMHVSVGGAHQATTALTTAYNHLEGALALALHLPVLVLFEENMDRTGIFASGIKPATIPSGATRNWTNSATFTGHAAAWMSRVRERRDVFLGYCSKADPCASSIRAYLEARGYTVLDWARDFRKAGALILEEIERAALQCRCAIFLFTKDDELEQNAQAKASADAVPRDNVLLEAGYFTQARGKDRVAIVREKGTKMPADLGGIIYLTLDDRKNLRSIKRGLMAFLKHAL
jgi:hypothetical protein